MHCKFFRPGRQAGFNTCLSLFFLLPVFILSVFADSCINREQIILKDSFNKKDLNKSLWEITESGDFSEKTVGIYEKRTSGRKDRVLILKAGTIRTSSPTKTLGIRSLEKIDFSEGIVIEADLDWNSQKNGSYLSAVFMLSPDRIKNMDKGSDFIAVEYSGVPPGRNIGVLIKRKVRRSLKIVYKDYGPADENGRFSGRVLDNSLIHIRIFIDKENISFSENGKEKYNPVPHRLSFSSGYFYIQMRTGTNYPEREIYFDNIQIIRSSMQ